MRDCQSTLAGVLPLTLLTQVSVTLTLLMTEEVKHCYSSWGSVQAQAADCCSCDLGTGKERGLGAGRLSEFVLHLALTQRERAPRAMPQARPVRRWLQEQQPEVLKEGTPLELLVAVRRQLAKERQQVRLP